MKKIFKSISIFSVLFVVPFISLAQGFVGACPEGTYNNGYGCFTPILGRLYTIQQILNSVLPVLITLGIVYFIWGVVTYVIAGDSEAKKTGRDRIIFGIIGLAVIVSVWGLVFILLSTFGLENPANLSVEFVQESGGIVKAGVICDLAANPKLSHLLNYGTCLLVNSIVPLLFGVALVVFVWGVVNFFILGAGEEAKRTQGKQFMLWGIIALAVMVSVWGLVAILRNTFGIEGFIPQVAPR
ncbi:MAG TPA: hypothetical protein VJB95_03310 [Candidatus Paceibacterota bacterium]